MKSTSKTKSKPSTKTIPYSGGNIRETEWGTYQADVRIGGKRKRKQFDELDGAKAFIDKQIADRDQFGELANAMTSKQIQNAADALHMIQDAGFDIDLIQVARFYLDHHNPKSGGWTVDQAFDAYMDEIENPVEGSPARPRTIADKRNRLKSFVDIYGEADLMRITEADVMDWLETTGAEGRNLRNYKTQIQSLFNYAERKAPGDYRNTIAKFPQKKAKEIDPAETLTPKQVEAVMKAIEGIDGKSAATMALCFFAGLRSDELASIGDKTGLDWSDIDLEEGIIRVPAAVAKTGKKRDIEITDNLKTWLTRYKQDAGTVSWSYTYFRKHREAACQSASVEWGNNLARHSFATYYARLHGKHAAAEQLGHRGNVSMIEDHYMGKTVRKDQALKYFKIMPKSGSKVIQISQAG